MRPSEETRRTLEQCITEIAAHSITCYSISGEEEIQRCIKVLRAYQEGRGLLQRRAKKEKKA